MVRTRALGVVGAMIPSQPVLSRAPAGGSLRAAAHVAHPRNHDPMTERPQERPLIVSGPDRSRTEREQEGGASMADYAKPDVLVSTDWLEEHLDDPDGAGRSRSTRTPRPTRRGTSAAPWGGTGRPTCTPKVGRDYQDQAGFSALLSAAGVGPDTTVVLYGGNNNWFAAYAYWLLKLRGFDNVKLLDGGRKKWELESRELDAGRPVVRADRVHDLRRRATRDPRAPRRGALRRWSRRPASSTCARPRSTEARSSRPTTCRRSRRRCPATSRAPRTSRGRRPRTTTERSSRRTSCGRSTRPRASPARAR